jgi:SAM-dependent methyltransferase
MDKQTLETYDRLTDKYFNRQEVFNHSYLSEINFLLKDLVQPSVLDIGTGSGKFVELLQGQGYQAVGIEPSGQMLEIVSERFPNRAKNLKAGSLPQLPKFENTFDLITALAVIPHIPRSELFLSFLRIKENLKTNGYFIFSLPDSRTDLDFNSRDRDGRLQIIYSKNEIYIILEQLGFYLDKELILQDEEGRSWKWSVSIMKLSHSQALPLDRIDSILNRERKTATYKPALLRALCDIALENQNLVTYESEMVLIPLRLIAEKWVVYFWNLFSAPVFLPQVSSELLEKPSALRKTFSLLQSKLLTLDDFLDQQALLRSGKLIDLDLQKQMNLYIQKWEQTIVKGPIKYSSEGNLFQYLPKQQVISLPVSIWREFVLLESWIRDAVILRWAEEMERISRFTIRTGQAIDYLMMGQKVERKQGILRELYLKKTSLLCVWTGKSLQPQNLDIDHAIPYTYWKNNYLWNLFPADATFNRKKRDHVPSSKFLRNRENAIRENWAYLAHLRPNQFDFEIRNFLGKYYEPNHWAGTLFSMFEEAAETIASRRGALRWNGD